MLVDRGGKLVTGGGVSLCIDTTLHLLAGMLGQHVADETGRIVKYQSAWRANRDGFAPMLSILGSGFQIALTSGRAASSHPCRLDRAGATCALRIQIAATCHTPAHNGSHRPVEAGRNSRESPCKIENGRGAMC
jgi:hypothetical protein